MADNASTDRQGGDAPPWIFDWRLSTSSSLRSWLAVLVAGGLFALMLLTLRVRVDPPRAWAAPRASVIQALPGGPGALLVERARAEGPFPSRFSPSDWDGAPAFEMRLRRAMRHQTPRHTPQLMAFPEDGAEPVRLAVRGEPVLPERPLGPLHDPVVGEMFMVPVISPVSGIGLDELPDVLPRLEVEAGELLVTRTWRFMLEVDGSGHVRDCIAMAGGNIQGLERIEQWLRGIVFPLHKDGGARWVSLSVEFNNRVIEDGADTE